MKTLSTTLKNNHRLRAGLLLGFALLALFMLIQMGVPAAEADYADGSGAGQYQSQIYWLDWQGFDFVNGASKTFTLPGGVEVTATVSNVAGGAVHIGRPEDYGPAAMNRAYPNTGHTAINSCDSCKNTFDLAFTADVAGTAVPVDLVVIDAEAAAPNEYLKVTTDGNTWQLLEQFQANNLRATFTNGDKTLELHGNGSTTYGTVLAVSTGVTNFNFEIQGGGVSAAALGVFLPFDYGDAPASYDDAGHYMRQVFSGGDPGATKTYSPMSTAFNGRFATISDSPDLFIGLQKPDADPGSQNTGVNAATALGDDNDGNDDEDGVPTMPPLTKADGSYAVDVPLHNVSGGAATLYGWVDFNGDGQFAADEVASVSVANNSVTAHLSWPSISVTALAGQDTYARLRLTTAALSDNGGTPAVDERAIGSTTDGEVEDYAIPIPTDPIKEAFTGCGLITFDSDALGFRTASVKTNRTINDGPHDAPYQQAGPLYFRWESTGGNPAGHLRGDDMDSEWQEVWTPVLVDPDFSAVIGQQIQFDYENNTGFSQYRLYVSVKGSNGSEYYYYFNDQLSAVNVWNHVTLPMNAAAWHTGFEALESPSTPPDSPPPTAQQFSDVLSSLERISISLEGIQGTDTSRFDNFGRACDYGDAPEATTQFETTGSDSARHNLSDLVHLGALIDSEVDLDNSSVQQVNKPRKSDPTQLPG